MICDGRCWWWGWLALCGRKRLMINPYLILYLIVDLKIPLKINSQLYKAGYIFIWILIASFSWRMGHFVNGLLHCTVSLAPHWLKIMLAFTIEFQVYQVFCVGQKCLVQTEALRIRFSVSVFVFCYCGDSFYWYSDKKYSRWQLLLHSFLSAVGKV